VRAEREGVVTQIATRRLGLLAARLGAGRLGAEGVDAAAGIWVHKKVGDFVQAGEVLATLQSSRPIEAELVAEGQACFGIGTEAPALPLVAGVISWG
jgi:pyrimidine-nucleoside phosphorylase